MSGACRRALAIQALLLVLTRSAAGNCPDTGLRAPNAASRQCHRGKCAEQRLQPEQLALRRLDHL